jgi:hypothetical protein
VVANNNSAIRKEHFYIISAGIFAKDQLNWHPTLQFTYLHGFSSHKDIKRSEKERLNVISIGCFSMAIIIFKVGGSGSLLTSPAGF